MWGFRSQGKQAPGFTLLEVIGVLAVIATLLSILIPNVIEQIDRGAREAEAQTLRAIGQGVEAYVLQNFEWPKDIEDLSPEFVPFGDNQLLNNLRGYERYLEIHPDGEDYKNDEGTARGNLSDLRFLVISDLTQDVNPNISNGPEFNAWWDTDDSLDPDLLIHRGTIKRNLHQVSLSAVGAGGSYEIDGRNTGAGGSGTLARYEQYHLTGTPVKLSENNSFGGGSDVTISFTLMADTGYQWNPNCAAGAKWHALGEAC